MMKNANFKDLTPIFLIFPSIKHLFWWVPESEIASLSNDAIVESILNNGNEKTVKQLLDYYGIDYVAEIFNRQASGRRNNYRPRTVNFFRKYFERHAQNSPSNPHARVGHSER